MQPRPNARPGSPIEVFRAFLRLGLTSFGGPVAHLGYFRDEFVTRRGWVDETAYADLVALCQFLPGPTSSQVGYALGLSRAGWAGGLAAWCGFTAPSAVMLAGFAFGAAALDGPKAAGLAHGLKLVAVAVVAQALWGMARTLTPDGTRAAIALAALLIVTAAGGSLGQAAAIAFGTLAGSWLCRSGATPPRVRTIAPASRSAGVAALVLFVALLAALPVLAGSGGRAVALFDAFYRAGALVFGGGHVVLPLLQEAVVGPGWIGADAFLAGYGMAQAAPGPLFAVAAFLGAAMAGAPNGLVGAAICLIAIFLPGLLLVTGALPFWDAVRTRPGARAAMSGANAAVVGVLAAALYDPLWTSAILAPRDVLAALAGFVLLTAFGVRPWIVVAMLAVVGVTFPPPAPA